MAPVEPRRALPQNVFVAAARDHRDGTRALVDDYDVRSSHALGRGMNGTVVLAIGRLDGRTYAVKRFLKRGMSSEQQYLMQREVEINLAVDHPHVVRTLDIYNTPKELTMVMECCTGGELFDRLVEQKRLAEHDAAAATRQMLRALSYLHAHRITHRDLKLENWLYESKQAEAPLKLIDFGLATIWGIGMPKMIRDCGSTAYVSPEVLCKQGYTNKCDLWSMGIIVYTLLSGSMPFAGEDEAAVKMKVQAGKVDWRAIDCHASHQARDFVSALLTINPERRLDADMALAHPWLERLAAPKALGLSRRVVLSMSEYAGAPRLHRAVLQLLARELLPEESRELSQLFLGLDRSNSGTLSVAELAVALSELKEKQIHEGCGPCFSTCSAPEKTGDQSPSSVTTVDTELQDWPSASSLSSLATADVDLEEWPPLGSTGCSAPALADLTKAEELFQVLDTSGGGEVYYSDFVAAALGSQVRLREQAMQRVFARLNAKYSGSAGAGDLWQMLGGPVDLPGAAEVLGAPGRSASGTYAPRPSARSEGAAARLSLAGGGLQRHPASAPSRSGRTRGPSASAAGRGGGDLAVAGKCGIAESMRRGRAAGHRPRDAPAGGIRSSCKLAGACQRQLQSIRPTQGAL